MLRIPFGWSRIEQRYVFAEEVGSGKACDCLCPSCSAPLQARLGQVRRPHFAHLTYGHEEHARDRCEFSFFVVAAAMARQLLASCEAVTLPRYSKKVAGLETALGTEQVDVQISEPQVVQVHRVSLPREGAKADVVIHVDQGELWVQVTHPDHPPTPPFGAVGEKVIGILEIDVAPTHGLYLASGRGTGFKEAFRSYVLGEVASKRWLYHQDEAAKVAEALTQVRAMHEARLVAARDRGSAGGTTAARVPPTPLAASRKSWVIEWAGEHRAPLPGVLANYKTMLGKCDWPGVYSRALQLEAEGIGPAAAIELILRENGLSPLNRLVLGFLQETGLIRRRQV